jgi:8-oxo-dGTP pyrophosphatase MutT (NUDIX family)
VSDLKIRPAVRGLVIDEADRVLLVRMQFRHWQGWLLPGGGTDGESDVVALRRELREETGLTNYELGPMVWDRTVHSPSLNLNFDGQQENVYLVRCQHFDVAPSMTVQELADEGLVGHRWFTVAELLDSSEQFRPRDLAQRVQRIVASGPPDEPDVFLEDLG